MDAELAERLASAVSEIVRGEFARTGQPTTGARLANELRSKWPGVDFAAFQSGWLALLASHAEASGQIARNRKVKHLELAPAGIPAGTPASATIKRGQQDSATGSQYLDPAIWHAFVGEHVTPVAFDKQFGRVVSFPGVSKVPDQPSFIAIVPISLEEQRQWVEEFLALEGLESENAPLDGRRWYTDFPAWLEGIRGGSARTWKRFRSLKVIARVTEWANSNGVPCERLFAHRVQPHCVEQASPAAHDSLKAKEAVLRAVNDMTLAELENLTIPVRLILRHFIAR